MKKLAFAVVAALLAVTAQARSGYKADFNSKYGTAGSVLDSCNTCHGATTSSWNVYGQALMIAGNITAGSQVSDAVINAALVAIEPLDSDGDTYTNIVEINARTLPYDANSKPTVVTYCVDADNDGWVVLVNSCTIPAGKLAGDCNDNNAAVNPGATEICNNGIDDNCNGLTDSADPVCPAPTSDYAITSLSVSGTVALRKTASVDVAIVLVSGSGPATLNVTATTTVKGRTKTVAIASAAVVSAAGTFSYPWKPSATGTWTILAEIVDGTTGETSGDTAVTTVVVP
ncbi:MAG TPA: putative metal-binding motif-containing protein [Anaeromyxobacter sp.]